MCPLWPFHLLLLYALVLGPLWMLSCGVISAAAASTWNVSFSPEEVARLIEGKTATVNFSTTDLSDDEIKNCVAKVVSDKDMVASVPDNRTYILRTEPFEQDGLWSSAFNVTGNFLGYASVKLQLFNKDQKLVKESSEVDVTVIREEKTIDRVFTYSVAILASIIYINMGCALDWETVKKTVRRPIGPIIGFISQCVFMPLVSDCFSLISNLILMRDSTCLSQVMWLRVIQFYIKTKRDWETEFVIKMYLWDTFFPRK